MPHKHFAFASPDAGLQGCNIQHHRIAAMPNIFRHPLLRLPHLVATVWLTMAGPVAAADLYQAQTIVSGTVLTTRAEGLAECLRSVLVKLSGNPALAGDPRLDALGTRADTLLDSLAYIDRMSDSPYHDEQGSRDRPFTLIARFNPARTDAALARLGEHPWRARRPTLAIDVMVQDHSASYSMTADGDNGERQREALLAAGQLYAMPIALPATTGIPRHPAGIALHGTLRWSDDAAGWVGDWHLDWRGRDHRWGISGVSYDDAFRNAVGGAMGVLSGHVPARH
jgi:hypothetical protein